MTCAHYLDYAFRSYLTRTVHTSNNGNQSTIDCWAPFRSMWERVIDLLCAVDICLFLQVRNENMKIKALEKS